MSNAMIILIEIILILNVQCLFESAIYIHSYNDVNKLNKKLKREGKTALILIYSETCPHCRRFEPDFIKLSEKYDFLEFFILSSKSNYKEIFKIRGVPTLFFFDGNKYIEHKGRNNFETISFILENDYLKKCKEINFDTELFKNIENDEQNYILGFFPNEILDNKENNNSVSKIIRRKIFENFIYNTNQIISLINNCYFIRNLNNNNNDLIGLNEGEIILFSKSKGISIFKEYQNIYNYEQEKDENYYYNRIEEVGKMYKKFLNEKLIDNYIDIIDTKMANKLNLFVKRNILLFVYQNDEQKKEFKNIINILTGISKNEKYPLFDYVLFKLGCNLYSISHYISSTGIYYLDKNLNKISKKIDLNIIINMINSQNDYEYNEEEILKIEKDNKENITENNKTNNIIEKKNEEIYYDNIRKKIIENELMNYLKNQKEEALLTIKNLNSVICFLICLLVYSLIFDYIYKIFYPNNSIFHIFNDFNDCISALFCENDEESLEIKEIKVKNKKIDEIN